MTPTFQRLIDDYAQSHQNHRNLICHFIGIPLVVFGVLGLLPRTISLGLLFAMMVFYVALDKKSLIPSLVALGSLYTASRFTSPSVLWVFFWIGWGAQLLGHFYFEKKRPAFLENPKHLLIGPYWLLAKVFRLAVR